MEQSVSERSQMCIRDRDKKVLVPDMEAGCSLADSCPADQFAQFVKEHPGHTVISYVLSLIHI